MHFDGAALFITAVIAVLAPLISEIPVGLRLPMVVVEVGLGIIVGPHVLGWAEPVGMLALLGYLGLIFLFFLAGMEIDFESVRGRPLKLAVEGWLLSVIIALALSGLLYRIGLVKATLLVAVALTTTGIGTLMPILRDSGELGTRFGAYVVAAGAMGEFGPIVLLSVIMTREHTRWLQTALMAFFVLFALLAAGLALVPKPPRIVAFIGATMNSTSQLPVRISIMVLALLIAVAEKFGLDLILGAFTAGMIVSLESKGHQWNQAGSSAGSHRIRISDPNVFRDQWNGFQYSGAIRQPSSSATASDVLGPSVCGTFGSHCFLSLRTGQGRPCSVRFLLGNVSSPDDCHRRDWSTNRQDVTRQRGSSGRCRYAFDSSVPHHGFALATAGEGSRDRACGGSTRVGINHKTW